MYRKIHILLLQKYKTVISHPYCASSSALVLSFAIKIRSLQVETTTTKREGWTNVNNICYNHSFHHIISLKILFNKNNKLKQLIIKIHTKPIVSLNHIIISTVQPLVISVSGNWVITLACRLLTTPLHPLLKSLVGKARRCHFLPLYSGAT